MASLWLNGSFIEEDEAHVSIRDTGLLHAAGVFTTLRAYGGKAFRIAQHLHRLRQSCEALAVVLPYSDEQLATAIRELLEQNELRDARLRLTVTRGASIADAENGIRLEPNVFLTAVELQPYPDELYTRGMTVIVLDDQKLNPYDIQAGHKTLNYFSRLAALRDAHLRGAGEALWFNVHNYLQSGSTGNIFLVKDGALITPPTSADLLEASIAQQTPYPKSAVLPGIIRQCVIELAAQMIIPVHVRGIDIVQLLDADEVFLTNSIMQVMPVCRIERKAIGNDRPGTITLRLIDALFNSIHQLDTEG